MIKPQSTIFTGGVRYTRDEPLRQARGEAQQVQVAFDAEGTPIHATFNSGVHMVERSRASEDSQEPWAVRDLTADHFEAAMTAAAPGTSELREAQATGNAHLVMGPVIFLGNMPERRDFADLVEIFLLGHDRERLGFGLGGGAWARHFSGSRCWPHPLRWALILHCGSMTAWFSMPFQARFRAAMKRPQCRSGTISTYL